MKLTDEEDHKTIEFNYEDMRNNAITNLVTYFNTDVNNDGALADRQTSVKLL